MKIIFFKSKNGYENLALEEAIFHNLETLKEVVMIYQNENAIIIGRNQNAYAEINQTFVEQNKTQVVRRISGGGAVYHDLGNINFSFVSLHQKQAMENFLEPIIDFLKTLGINAKFQGKNDLTIDNKKISGSAQSIYKNKIMHHGTLLYKVNFAKMQYALKVDNKKMESKGIKSIRQRVANISAFLENQNISNHQFAENLVKHFINQYGAEELQLSNEIKKIAQDLKVKRASWRWIYGTSPQFNLKHTNRFDGGTLTVKTLVENGLIQYIRFEGDFMSRRDVADIQSKLVKIKFIKNDILNILNLFNLEDYFGKLTNLEIVKTIFGE